MDNLNEKQNRIGELVMLLNYYRDLYYNQNVSEISDYEYDKLFDELKALEYETGFILPSSPTQSVGYTVVSELKKVKHNHPMLSLDKTKSYSDVVKFLNGKEAVCMAKMDGLTCSLHYQNGKLVSAETRGDGEIGEDVTHNIKVIENVPQYIDNYGDVVIDGEVIIDRIDFKLINEKLPEDSKYKNPRNLASGGIRQLDSSIAKSRNMQFVAWKFVQGSYSTSFYKRWEELVDLGFSAVPILSLPLVDERIVEHAVELIKKLCDEKQFPIDGCVFGYDDILYGEILGQTAHHLKSQLAFKFYDETVDTKLQYVDWTIGKTGVLTPTAVFDPVEIDGTTVTRASLHNLSIMKELGIRNHCTVSVYKANQIIPQIDSCQADGDSDIEYPKVCPICGSRTVVIRTKETEVLECANDKCAGKMLAKFENFVSRKCADIDGLSEATLEEFINRGYIHNYKDLYHLDRYADEMKKLEGFGERSVTKLLESVENSRKIKLENYINALGIDGIGLANAKVIAKYFDNDVNKFYDALQHKFDFTQLDGFGTSLHWAIYRWYTNSNLAEDLMSEFEFVEDKISSDNSLSGLKFCITGTFSEPREVLVKKLEDKGAVFVSSVSKKLDVLFCGDKAGSKLEKAKSLGVKVSDEDELKNMLGEN